jgi:drug/metabolite transporter (DMT)-like permease
LSPSQKRQFAYLLIVVTPALWGVNYLVARLAADTVAPHALALGRWCIAGAVMLFITRAEIAAHRAAVRREWKQFVVFGLLGMWICGAFVYLGARTTSATNIGLLYAISPVLIALVSTFVLKERMAPLQAAGVALALAGVVHVVLKGRWAALAQVQFTAGDLWILTAAMSWTTYALLLKAWPSAFGPAARLALSCVAGAVVLVPFAIVEALWFMPTTLNLTTLGYTLAVAVFPGIGAYVAYAFMQRELGAARAGVVLYLGPLYSAGLAWAVLGESVHPFHLAGAALILPGIYLATRRATAR